MCAKSAMVRFFAADNKSICSQHVHSVKAFESTCSVAKKPNSVCTFACGCVGEVGCACVLNFFQPRGFLSDSAFNYP